MFGLFGAKKDWHAAVNTTETPLLIPAGDTLLNAALEAGISWPHNCRVGSCGTCRCKLKSGKIKALNDFSYVLDEDELDDGMILACQTRPMSDLEITVELDQELNKVSKAESVKGEITYSELLTHDILEVRVQLNDALPPYLAGQYAEISTSSIDAPRSYSFSRAPENEETNTATFFVRLVPNGEMTTWLHAEPRVGETVQVNGPLGSFFLRDADTPIVCIAGGSGLAPIKALLEQMIVEGVSRPVRFLFGARTQEDLYCLEDIEGFKKSYLGDFEFVPVLSHEPEQSTWQGLRGMVTEYIAEDSHRLSSSQAYLCGPPPMIDSAIAVLNDAGVKENQIFFDKFLDASHAPRN
ncbi:MAG: 2Fe-2S iron-sulfur cluster binding domain-containing protein [Acidiferrobacterales bacterium]|nr:2Fe-2S iron-sulfur cluster binding domain-containing protein [Acidiferrobacterales bacterium]